MDSLWSMETIKLLSSKTIFKEIIAITIVTLKTYSMMVKSMNVSSVHMVSFMMVRLFQTVICFARIQLLKKALFLLEHVPSMLLKPATQPQHGISLNTELNTKKTSRAVLLSRWKKMKMNAHHISKMVLLIITADKPAQVNDRAISMTKISFNCLGDKCNRNTPTRRQSCYSCSATVDALNNTLGFGDASCFSETPNPNNVRECASGQDYCVSTMISTWEWDGSMTWSITRGCSFNVSIDISLTDRPPTLDHI